MVHVPLNPPINQTLTIHSTDFELFIAEKEQVKQMSLTMAPFHPVSQEAWMSQHAQ